MHERLKADYKTKHLPTACKNGRGTNLQTFLLYVHKTQPWDWIHHYILKVNMFVANKIIMFCDHLVS